MDIRVIAQKLVKEPKGILAADRSNKTMNKSLKTLGLEESEETRRKYRQLLFTTPGIEEYVSGVILYDETIRQKTDEGVLFTEVLKGKGIFPGIKVDEGLIPYKEEKTTTGLAGLPGRLREYKEMGAVFAKWRAVTIINEQKELPTDDAINHNSDLLAEYAILCQKEGIVPIVEPEVLINGVHNLEKSREVTEKVLTTLFDKLREIKVDLEGVLLKTSMVIAGSEAYEQTTPENVAKFTNKVLQNTVPKEVPGVVFLSGGQKPLRATENLNEISKIDNPWKTTFSYSRALQEPVLDAWKEGGDAQGIFLHRLKMNSLASIGKYTKDLE